MIQQRLAMVWQDRTLREQRLLLLAAWLIFMGCIFFGVIDPALTGRRYWLQTLPLLRDEQTQMQALAKQLSQLQTEQVASTSNLDRTTIERSLAAAGLTPASLQLSEQQLKLEWVNISFSAQLFGYKICSASMHGQ